MSKLWWSLEQVEVTMYSASACAFLRSCTLGIPGKRWISVLLHTTFLTALTVPWEASKSGWRGTEVGGMWENVFSEESSLWHIAQGYSGVLASACCSNVSLPAAHFSSCFVPHLQSTLCKLQTQFWSTIIFLCQGLVASRQIKAATTLALRSRGHN